MNKQLLLIQDAYAYTSRYHGPMSAAFQADGKRLVTANERGEVKTWDVDTGRLVCSAPGPEVGQQYPTGVTWAGGDHVQAVSFLVGGDYVLAVYDGSFIKFFDAHTCRLAGTFSFEEQVAFLSFSRDGATMMTILVVETPGAVLENLRLWPWDLRGIDLRSAAPIRLSPSSMRELPEPIPYFSPDHVLLWIDNTPHVWRPGEAQPIGLEWREFTSRSDLEVAFSADGTHVAVVSGREARVWDTRSGKLLVAFKDEVRANWDRLMALSPDGSRMLIACKDNTARIYPTSREDFLGVARRLLGR